MLCLTHWFFLYIKVVGMKNKKLTADQISSPAFTSVIWQKPVWTVKQWIGKKTQTTTQNCVNKIPSEEGSQGVDKTVHSGLMVMILNPHLHEYLIPPFSPLKPPMANQNIQPWFQVTDFKGNSSSILPSYSWMAGWPWTVHRVLPRRKA